MAGQSEHGFQIHRLVVVKIIFKVLFCITILIGTAEVSLRYFLGLGHPVLFVGSDLYGAFPRGSQDLYRFGQHIFINSDGMRSREISKSKPPKEKRILFVGDSVTFGTTFVDQLNIFTSKIELDLNNDGRFKYEILNASSPGWASENEFQYLRSNGVRSADLVVLVYNTKDLTQKFSPFIESALVPTQNPSSAITELWSRYIEPRLGLSPVNLDPGSTGNDGIPSDQDNAQFLKTVAKTRDFIVGQGSKFAILFIPSKTPDVISQQSLWTADLEKLKQWASASNISLIDLTKTFSEPDPKEIYFDGIHLRPKGNSLTASVFADWAASSSF